MRRVGLHVSERSFNLAMAACLEGHGGGPTETKVGTKPHDGDNPPAMTALRLFDQLVDTGATPTGLTYRLALKARYLHRPGENLVNVLGVAILLSHLARRVFTFVGAHLGKCFIEDRLRDWRQLTLCFSNWVY